MASNPPDAAQWRIAVRFLTFGVMMAGLVAVMWWLGRLADHLEAQRVLLVQIQADVLVNHGQASAVLATAEQINRRMVNVEERAGRASEDRQQLRATDQQLTEALIRLRAMIDAMHDPAALRDDPADEPGPKTRPRLRRE